MVQESV
jgi:hypothetical protein